MRRMLARSVAPALAVDVHIFTSTIADERRYRSKYTRRFWTSADFDVFRRRGVSVHIDSEAIGIAPDVDDSSQREKLYEERSGPVYM